MKMPENKQFPHTIPEALSRYENSEAIALICGEEELSYRELIADAKQIAHALLARGVSRGDRVLLDMSRSADYVRMYLGVIYAGAVKVTLHSGWPAQQRASALASCAPKLTVDDTLARELIRSPLNPEAAACPLPEMEGADPFQIVYTSGSTGVPKGVANCHMLPIEKYLLTGTDWEESTHLQYFRIHCQRLLTIGNLAFVELSNKACQVFLAEKTLVVATEEDLRSPGALAACIRRCHVDTLFGSATLYYAYLSDSAFRKALSGVKMMVLGGESGSIRVLNAFLKYGNINMYYGYGQTETWLDMISLPYRGEAEILYEDRDLPVRLLEKDGMGEVPDGTAGEICVGGSAGQYGFYWNDQALTAAKYIDHPRFGRLFRTGDLARREPDGRIRVLGRTDRMAKLHGLRIELDAIELEMEQLPGVDRAAVKIQGEGASAVLCGYYSGSVDQGALRRSLAETLPYYMVPALLRELRSLPLNLNGKLDRLALPPIETRAEAYAAPETEQETLLCEVFAQVLHRDTPVGIDDSFFELGGDSVQGLGAGALLGELGYELKVEWLFAAPTVRALAPMLLPLETVQEDNVTLWSVELSHGERRLVEETVGLENIESVYPVLPGMQDYLHRGDACWICTAFFLDEAAPPEALRQRLAESVQCHQSLRTVIVAQGAERALQVVLRDWEPKVFTVDLRHLSAPGGETLSEAQVRYFWSLYRLYLARPISSSQVMFETGLVQVSERRTVLVLACSHLLLDGLGYRRIQEELAGGVPIISDVRKYNRYMRRLLSADYRAESRRVWSSALARSVSALPIVPGPAGGHVRVLIAGSAFSEQAAALCARASVTLSALTCLALGKALMALCGTREAGFLSTTNGRDADHSLLTGMFTGVFPVTVEEGDTLLSLQAQLVQASGWPVPDMESPDFARQLPESFVCLSMESYLHMAQVQDLYRTTLMTALAGAPSGNPGAGAPNRLMVLVEPHAPFQMTLLYNGACCDRATVDRFGQRMLTELRRIVEEAGMP